MVRFFDVRHPNYGVGDPGHAVQHVNIVAVDSEADRAIGLPNG